MISPLLNYIAILLSLLQSVASHPGLPNVTEHTITQNIDHFGYDANTGTYQERYFTYDKYLATPNSPTVIFFYCGNEDNVELYVNNTGLMWQLGKKMNALLVFAEHRYYGKSLPVPPPTTKTSITSTSNSSSSSPTSACRTISTSRWVSGVWFSPKDPKRPQKEQKPSAPLAPFGSRQTTLDGLCQIFAGLCRSSVGFVFCTSNNAVRLGLYVLLLTLVAGQQCLCFFTQ